MSLREETLQSLRDNPAIPVLIVGAGINGIGVFRDLTLQGVDALLIDKADYCAGTSAASTRIIHGGLRYLENAEFRLVREALRERGRLLRNAPHYVKPLPITIPVHNWTSGMIHAIRMFLGLDGKPGQRGALVLRTGLTLYDAFAGADRGVPSHSYASRGDALRHRPQLTKDICCTLSYYDAAIACPERLGLELVMDARADAGPDQRALALNYVSLAGADGAEVTLRDEITGETLTAQPQIVINASGAWIDFTNQAMKRPTHFIGGTKGSHLVLDHPELHAACDGNMMYFVNDDARICIFYPFFDKVIAGSTDLPANDPDKAYCDEDETEYILESIRQVFPEMTVSRDDIVFTFSGVRPLPAQNTQTTGQISRDHKCEITPAGGAVDFPVYSLVGGKWTTYRAFSEQVTDQALADLGAARWRDTADLGIGGGADYPRTDGERVAWIAALRQETGLPEARLNTLFERYGTRATLAAAAIAAADDAPLASHPDYSQAEIRFLLTEEEVQHLDDIILRRTLIGMLGELTPALLDELADIAAAALGWDDARRQSELERVRSGFAAFHGVTL